MKKTVIMAADSSGAILDDKLEELEEVFSSESRKIRRQIKIEWHKMKKYKDDLSSAENRLLSANENLAHLKEIKCENEKYERATRNRIESLTLSNKYLKSKVSNLKKEEQRIAKKYVKEKEYMDKNIALYEEKWRLKYEAHYSKNPKLQEKVKAVKELSQLEEVLFKLETDIQKCEAEIFHAKFEINKKPIEKSIFYPLETFMVSIAKLYLETKNVFEQCETLSKEIAVLENTIATQYAKLQNSSPSKKNSSCNETEAIYTENNSAERRIIGNKVNHPHDEHVSSSTNWVKDEMTEINEATASSVYSKLENESDFNENKKPNMTKIQKWMEKFKICVPKFTDFDKSDTEVDKQSPHTKLLTECLDSKNLQQAFSKEKEKLFCNSEAMDVDILNEKVTSPTLNPLSFENSSSILVLPEGSKPDLGINICKQIGDSTMKQGSIEHKALNLNMSKYFQNVNSYIPLKEQIENSAKNNSLFQENINKKLSTDNNEISMNTRQDSLNTILTENSKFLSSAPITGIDNESKYNMSYQIMKNNEIHMDFSSGMDIERSKCNDNFSNKTKENYDIHDISIHATSIKMNTDDFDEIKMNTSKYFNEMKTENVGPCAEIIKETFQTDSFQLTHKLKETQYLKNMQENDTIDSISNIAQKSEIYKNQIKLDNVKVSEVTPIQKSENQEIKETHNILKFQDFNAVNQSKTNGTIQHIPQPQNSIPSPTNNDPVKQIVKKTVQVLDNQSNEILSNVENNSEKDSEIYNLTSYQTPLSNTESNLRESSNKPAQNSDPQIAENVSPGFTYLNRPMYQAVAANNPADSQNIPKDLDGNFFAHLNFFNNILVPPGKSEEDGNDFLASTYEDYLKDSPPVMKQGSEKSMFAFTEHDSPEDKEGQSGLFPLFATNNAESDKDNNTPFMLNFGASSSNKSPSTNSEFKFLF